MKKLLIISLLALAVTAAGQQNPAVYASYAPQDNGLGLRIDISGGYLSIAYGNYKLPDDGYIKDHLKLSMGFVTKHFSLGLAYHEWGEVKETVKLEKRNLRRLSVEGGVRVYLDKIIVGTRYDILRNEGMIEVGFLLPCK